ncbi:hypothetical protein CPLU01_14733 [Colletotrichum plurivorum]|uniref:Uncharacterized protein n=1 Tax=Colletotrichum plurivorum TaxID=2175906 RepID=A0A8H6JHG9_9PEZI|nr:hypothetical protein CPLU01_14733 [Colletotrichum plurivorum]
MSQQGGVYPPRDVKVPGFAKPASPSRYKYAEKAEDTKPAAEKSTEEPKVTDTTKRLEPSSGVQAQDEGKSDGQQWEVLNAPKEEQEEDKKYTGKQEGGFSSNFNLQLGWGKWKFTPLSWEVNVNNQAQLINARLSLSILSQQKKRDFGILTRRRSSSHRRHTEKLAASLSEATTCLGHNGDAG